MATLHSAGTVLWVLDVVSPKTGESKDRPVVLLADLTDADDELLGVAVSSAYHADDKVWLVELPYGRDSGCKSGLVTQSWAVCNVPVRRITWGCVTGFGPGFSRVA